MRTIIGYIDIFITKQYVMIKIEKYKSRFLTLIESTMGNVKPLLSESDGKTKEEYPACVQNLGDVVTGGGGISTITDKQGNKYFSNNKAQLQPGVPGNTDIISIKMVDYFCAADGTIKFGKPDSKELLLINAKKCGWGTDVKAYEASGWKCDSKMDVSSIIKDTAVNIQNKLVSLGKDIGPRGVDGKIGPTTMKAIWDVLKTVK